MLPVLFVFVLVILAGLVGTPIGGANSSIVFAWIVWWGALIVLLIPLGARAWCAVCPIAAVGEWVQRRAILAPGSTPAPNARIGLAGAASGPLGPELRRTSSWPPSAPSYSPDRR